MYIDISIHRGTDMFVDTCIFMRKSVHMCMGLDMCIDMCTNMCANTDDHANQTLPAQPTFASK